MITRENYLKKIEAVDLSKLDSKLKASKAYFDALTNNGKSWKEIEESSTQSELLESYFKALDIELKKLNPKENKSIEFETKTRSISSIKRTDPIILELRFLRRYINLDGKVKTKRQIKLFLSALQRSIVGLQIRKSSEYAKHIMILQDDLIDLIESFKRKTKQRISIPEEREERILNLLGRKSQPQGIKVFKEFVKLQGQTVSKAEIRRMHNKIGRYLNRKKDQVGNVRDNLSIRLLKVTNHLRELYNSKGISRKINVDNKTLNGIRELAGLKAIEETTERKEETPEKKKVYLA